MFLCLLSTASLGFVLSVLGVFRGDLQQVKEYQDLLAPLLHQTTEGTVRLPKFFLPACPCSCKMCAPILYKTQLYMLYWKINETSTEIRIISLNLV